MTEKRNGNACSQWCVTFSQCGTWAEERGGPEVAKFAFVQEFPPRKYAVCSVEDHEDGGIHFHLGLILEKGLTKPKMLKWINAKFPEKDDGGKGTRADRIKIEPTRNTENWGSYCMKEDPLSYREGDFSLAVNKGGRPRRAPKVSNQEWAEEKFSDISWMVLQQAISKRIQREVDADWKKRHGEANWLGPPCAHDDPTYRDHHM